MRKYNRKQKTVKEPPENKDVIWDPQNEVCNDYCCTVQGDFIEIVKKYVINEKVQ